LIKQIADIISSTECTHPLRVAIDGVDAAGKTTLANELVEPLEKRGRNVIRASIDRFHNPRKIRYQKGNDSPEGYFYDSFDNETIIEILLKPLGPNGSLQYRTGIFDYQSDSQIKSSSFHTLQDSILIFDGVFLLRSELVKHWDFTIFLDVEFDIVVERASHRDQSLFGSPNEVKERYEKRYIPGQKIYLKSCQPHKRADIVINNNDPINPRII
jgi:uridine kinase